MTHYIFNTFDKTATQSNKEYEETIDSKLLHQINKYKQELDIEKEETIHSKQEIQSLVTHISHQVKTPLANIKIYNDLLARNDLSKEEAIDFHIMLNQQINKLDFLMESKSLIMFSYLLKKNILISNYPKIHISLPYMMKSGLKKLFLMF